MSLNATTLENALLAIIDGSSFPATPAAAGIAWGNAYDSYAVGADSCASIINPPSTSAALPGLKTAWATALSNGMVAGAAVAVAGALVVFWPLVTFPGDPPATPSLPPIVNPAAQTALVAALTATFTTGITKGAATVANEIATAMDTYTKTVTVTHLNSPPTVPSCGPLAIT